MKNRDYSYFLDSIWMKIHEYHFFDSLKFSLFLLCDLFVLLGRAACCNLMFSLSVLRKG